jgi:hypothetical protein
MTHQTLLGSLTLTLSTELLDESLLKGEMRHLATQAKDCNGAVKLLARLCLFCYTMDDPN